MSNLIAIARRYQLVTLFITLTSFNVTSAHAQGSHRVINVKTFGATGNGTTDDTSAIQAALTAAGTNTAAEVYFPTGNYLISSPLTANGINLVGQSGATLVMGSTADALHVSGTSPSVTGLTFTSSTSALDAIFLNQATNAKISNNTFRANYNKSIQVFNDSGSSITGNTFSNANGVNLVEVFNATDTSLSGNQFSIAVSSGAGVSVRSSSGVTLSKNQFTLASNLFNVGAIIVAQDQNTLIESNTFTSNSSSPANAAVATSSCSGSQITKNTVTGFGTGFLVNSDTSPSLSYNNVSNSLAQSILLVSVSNATVTNNSLINSGDAAIFSESSAGTTTISTNTIAGAGNFGIRAANGGNAIVAANAISNCGLKQPVAAVIFVNEPSATAVSITGNQYKGNTTNLTYFIDAVQSFASVSGNKTNSLLPSKVGP